MRPPSTLIFLASLALFGVEVVTSLEVEEPGPSKEAGLWNSCHGVREEAYAIRNEGYSAVNKADEIREQAYRAKDEALEIKEEALEIKESVLEGRLALETTLVETLALMKTQTTVNNLYIQEMRATLSALAASVESLESKAEERATKLDNKIEELQDKVTESVAVAGKVGKRQEVWMSEIRLISHFKLTEQNRRHAQGYDSDIVVDGQFLFATTTSGNMRPYSHSGSSSAGNKLVVKLGGIFRVHKIKLWNTRDACCMSRLIGLHVYADGRLIGTVIQTLYTYDFIVAEEDAVYAETVTVKQPLAAALHLIEVQVWGNGPFDRDDIFA